MGIRIHKVLGYGISGLKEHGLADLWEKWDGTDVEDFRKYMNDFAEGLPDNDVSFTAKLHVGLDYGPHSRFFSKDKGLDSRQYSELKLFDLQEEFGEDVCVFMPTLDKNQWYRYNDDIDYFEESLINPDATSRLVYKQGCLYPFTGHMRPADNELGVDYYYDNSWRENPNRIPVAPYSIKKFLDYMGFENSLDIYFKLRPCLHVYWC